MEEAENAHRLLENILYYYTTQTLNQVIHKTVDMEELTQTLNQVIHKTLDMEDAGEAHRLLESGSVLGKLVLRAPCSSA
jgi:NADPH:quinone reductase-like Zn-dependent oxidoreductase